MTEPSGLSAVASLQGLEIKSGGRCEVGRFILTERLGVVGAGEETSAVAVEPLILPSNGERLPSLHILEVVKQVPAGVVIASRRSCKPARRSIGTAECGSRESIRSLPGRKTRDTGSGCGPDWIAFPRFVDGPPV